MSKHDPKVTLSQITDFARQAQELCAQNELPAILTDWHKRLAFERVMEILGEARETSAAGIMPTPSRSAVELIAGMRDRVSHGYDAIDYATLWDTVQDDVPGLLATVERMLAEMEAAHKKNP
jgi:uncharacterized protein with HEPN domain